MNKSIVITAIALIFIFCIGIVYFVGFRQKNSENEEADVRVEQDKDDAIVVDEKQTSDVDKKQESGTGLEMLEPNEVATENITDASGSWENTQESEQGFQDEVKQDDKEESTDDNKEEQDVLEDDITWGDIY